VFNNTGTSIRSGTTLNGEITIQADQYFVLEELPNGFYYKIVELPHTDYVLNTDDSKNLEGRLNNSGIRNEATAVNDALKELAIANTTPNKCVANTGQTNAGGRVVVRQGNEMPLAYDLDDYKKNMLAVAWEPEEFWHFGNSLSIFFTNFGETDENVFTIDNFIDMDDNLLPREDWIISDETLFASRFPDAYIVYDDNALVLNLCDDLEKMPRKTRVLIDFEPTLAVKNKTPEFRGGEVMVYGGVPDPQTDGVPTYPFNGTPYRAALSVFGIPNEGFQTDTANIIVRNMDDLDGDHVVLTFNPGTFNNTLDTVIAGQPALVPIQGVVFFDDNDITIEFNSLPIPLQVDLLFIPISADGGSPGEGYPDSGYSEASMDDSPVDQVSVGDGSLGDGFTGEDEDYTDEGSDAEDYMDEDYTGDDYTDDDDAGDVTGDGSDGDDSASIGSDNDSAATFNIFARLPQTGENTPIGIIIGVGIISAICAVLLLIIKRKPKKEK
jgi:LPXTG-motif cell wall-anchored protein